MVSILLHKQQNRQNRINKSNNLTNNTSSTSFNETDVNLSSLGGYKQILNYSFKINNKNEGSENKHGRLNMGSSYRRREREEEREMGGEREDRFTALPDVPSSG